MSQEMRVQLVLMIDAGPMTTAQIEGLKRRMGGMDWAALHEIDQEGEDPESFLSGGFNPHRLLVKDIGSDWREEPF